MSNLTKEIIHTFCAEMLREKQQHIQQSIADARAASNSDTKSSMGDKYETTREMMQIEIEKLSLQLAEIQKNLALLNSLNPHQKYTEAVGGSLVETDAG